MSKDPHFSNLENMYLHAPINVFYKPQISISLASSEITIALRDELFHPAGAVHGSVYFKMLDDAAFFAANSLEREFFVLTTSFTTYITRPVSQGIMRANAKVVNQNRSQFITESVVYDSQDREIARGNGIFVRGKFPLVDALGYVSEA